ncbi:MAG: CYTH domain-containing protein [Myxococcota bacterium]|nr:CYTH domain-containing protein [Myxococcota bacterium]
MAQEIERKFVVDMAQWQADGEGERYEQGYLSSHAERVVRVRIEGPRAKLTIKGATRGVTRAEFEYDIPIDDAQTMLRTLCEQPVIEKHRHRVPYEGKTWEVDVFGGENVGLVIAELELAAEDEPFAVPPWAVREVSDDPRYYNSNLVKAPYRTWRDG